MPGTWIVPVIVPILLVVLVVGGQTVENDEKNSIGCLSPSKDVDVPIFLPGVGGQPCQKSKKTSKNCLHDVIIQSKA